MTNTFLVFISTSYDNALTVCKALEGKSFSALSQLYEQLGNDLEGETDADEEYLVYSIENFTEAVNGGQMDVITEYYSTYITIGG